MSLTVYDAPSDKGVADLIEKISGTFKCFPIQFSSVGFFPGPENVVFLAPVVTKQLLDIHASLHQGLDRLSISSWSHYRPDAWVPHVGVFMGSASERDEILKALLGKQLWGSYQVSAIEYIRFSPGKLLHRAELRPEFCSSLSKN